MAGVVNPPSLKSYGGLVFTHSSLTFSRPLERAKRWRRPLILKPLIRHAGLSGYVRAHFHGPLREKLMGMATFGWVPIFKRLRIRVRTYLHRSNSTCVPVAGASDLFQASGDNIPIYRSSSSSPEGIARSSSCGIPLTRTNCDQSGV
jgi:hypothetical protein